MCWRRRSWAASMAHTSNAPKNYWSRSDCPNAWIIARPKWRGEKNGRGAVPACFPREPLFPLCDEPTGNLDRQSAENVASLLLDLHKQRQTILIMVTHSAELAAKFPARFELIE